MGKFFSSDLLPPGPSSLSGRNQRWCTPENRSISKDLQRPLKGPCLHLSLAEPKVADSFPAGSWRVARDWSAYSGKATPGLQGVITIKAHTNSLCFFAILLKETLDFGAFQIQSGFKLVLSLSSLKKQAFAL